MGCIPLRITEGFKAKLCRIDLHPVTLNLLEDINKSPWIS